MSYFDGVIDRIRDLEAERTKYKVQLETIRVILQDPKKACDARSDFAGDSQYPLSKYKELVYSLLEVLDPQSSTGSANE